MGAARQMDFNVEKIEAISLAGPAEVSRRALMSPYVWRGADGGFHMMVRAVPKAGDHNDSDTGTIWYATSPDGVAFTATDGPVIAPGPGSEDIGGCEDPTVVELPNGGIAVYYTGVDATRSHGEMLYAEGPSIDQLVKKGVAMASTPSEGNVKEATVDRTKGGQWRLFYEYALDGASLIGLALGDTVAGPWTHEKRPFAPREEAWDRWHLSTGPMLTTDKDRPVMFYNGATEDARWRIGWIAFDAEYRCVVDRCVEPLIAPPPKRDRMAVDIAFAASIVADDTEIWLYYSRADESLYRARIRRS